MIKRKTNLIIIVILIIGLLPIRGYSQEQEKYLEGIKLYQEGKYERAVEIFSGIVKKSLDKDLCFNSYIYLGYTYFTIGEHEQARFYIEKGVEMKQNVDLHEDEFIRDFILFYRNCKDRIVGIAFIESIPSEASIFMDNKKLGITPIKKEFLSQKYYMRLVKGGYDPVVREIEIEVGEVNHFKFDLRRERNWKTFLRSSLVMIVAGVLISTLD